MAAPKAQAAVATPAQPPRKDARTPSHASPTHRSPRRPGAIARQVTPYLLVAPAILGIAFLLVYPVAKNTVLSFQDYNLKQLFKGGAEYIGFDNFTTLFKDSDFWEVTWRTFWFTGIQVVVIMVVSTLIALMVMKLGKAMRVLVLIGLVAAWATPVIAATTIFKWLFRSDNGVVNWALVQLGFDSYQNYTWFAHGGSTLFVVGLLIVWQSIPFATLTIYAGLTTISSEIYESARLDGAGPVRIFRSITFPMLRPIFALVTSLEVIWIFKSFAQIWSIAGENGPINDVRTLPVYAFQMGTSLHHYGMSGAVATVTVLLIALMLVFYFRQMFKQEREAGNS
ncbi:carbohydrate ABC transporter permease [Yinghuangia seranimata]|uniref:carbohydrate ABC transporter permease n=1 Tax=Yinghuangia seranimata TaxID=408067 RepID=UPI00248D0738|nr:sugar ABC transporter permease [Yinghuangia seranimata]MDI2128076.1 sugar ABC transporter permease [Yinghuangia seranimata]